MYKELTPMQKLQAIADKHYSGLKWIPKKGDYYTSSRADLELYQIIDEDEKYFYTVYSIDPDCNKEFWEKDKFLKDFGENRVLVSPYIFKHIK